MYIPLPFQAYRGYGRGIPWPEGKHEEVGEIIPLSIMNDSDNIQYGRIVATPKDLWFPGRKLQTKSKYSLQNGGFIGQDEDG